MAKTQSPCLGICTYRRAGPAGRHCLACSMTKAQKALAKQAKSKAAREGFIALVMAQQAAMGRYGHWRSAYLARAAKKGRRPAKVVTRAD
ncbi:DUF1289 domain-containing protein [uncultured Jannaschia sp.]|uniref:DUF1289 domain-containing protein n=1 Tax=uncultured Jannaschia sp. TaxID=293347 RepID=UPI0026307D79|nr:DUF1289 domain-containing protein [uncultured Jannaschia sp.]